MFRTCSTTTNTALLLNTLGSRALHSSDLATKQSRRPLRGGHDLTHRYQRLEKSIREKFALSHNIADLSSPSPGSTSLGTDSHPLSTKDTGLHVFRGMIVPQEPRPPESDDCCMSGCAVCVYDLYDESLKAYKEAVASLRTSSNALGIPEAEWPPSIQPQQHKFMRPPNAKGVSLDAFEVMEQALKAKRENEQRDSRNDPSTDGGRQARKADSFINVRTLCEALQWVVFGNR